MESAKEVSHQQGCGIRIDFNLDPDKDPDPAIYLNPDLDPQSH
jgi:hypothetical protein